MYRGQKRRKTFFAKTVDKQTRNSYNNQRGQREPLETKVMGICLMVGRRTLTPLVGVRFSHPQPPAAAAIAAAAFLSGHSAVGSAPRSGRGGRGFKSRCSDQNKEPLKRLESGCFSGFLLCQKRFPARVAGRKTWPCAPGTCTCGKTLL